MQNLLFHFEQVFDILKLSETRGINEVWTSVKFHLHTENHIMFNSRINDANHSNHLYE